MRHRLADDCQNAVHPSVFGWSLQSSPLPVRHRVTCRGRTKTVNLLDKFRRYGKYIDERETFDRLEAPKRSD